MKAYNQGDYTKAWGFFERAIKESSSNVNAYYYDAQCLYRMNDRTGAMQRFKEIVDKFPKSGAAPLAKTALSTLSGAPPVVLVPAVTPVQRAMTAAVRAATARAKSDDAPPDLASLPDTASFWFDKGANGHMDVQVMINGHPVHAIFDTGADAHFYRDQLAQSGIDTHASKAAGFARGWAGRKVAISTMPAKVQLGTLTRNLEISIQDENDGLGHNLIGQDLINGYQYEIDDFGQRGRVNLHKSMAVASEQTDPLYDLPCDPSGSRDHVDIMANNHKVRVFIDTGASSTIFDQATADACGIESTGSAQMVGVGGGFTCGLGTAHIRMGPIDKDFQVHIGGTSGNCIGQDFMSGWRFK
ncbi:MAG: retroviral-like aspartic protease family protein, partial [bacterium]